MNKLGKIFIIVGILLIIISSLITIKNNYEDVEAKDNSNNVLKVIKSNIEENQKNSTDNNESNNVVKTTKKDNTLEIDGNKYIGIITIPTLNIELPIMSDYNENKLKIAPCVYYGTLTNRLIICAHSYRNHFGNLGKLNQGDIIIITDINGDNIIYEVLEIEVLNSDDITYMIDTEFDLTLYTCTNDGTKRITVRANKV